MPHCLAHSSEFTKFKLLGKMSPLSTAAAFKYPTITEAMRYEPPVLSDSPVKNIRQINNIKFNS